MKPITMTRHIDSKRKVLTGMVWPARLDQELRKAFGDELKPKTFYDKHKSAYVTSFDEDWPFAQPNPLMAQREVLAFIAGFHACVEMVTE